MRTRGSWFLTAMILLSGLTLYTRGAAPWQEALTNDEMLHLESWRNHYRTDDICPSLVARAEITGLLEGEKLELFKKVYYSSTIFQRGLIVLNDLHPPTFAVLAELLEMTTHSSLVAVRMVSAIASALAVLFMYRLGRDLRDRTLGLWLAALLAIGYLAQLHAGIARPYALTQFALILALSAFVRDELAQDRSPWRFLLASLFVQSTDWPVWVIMLPLLAVMVIRRFRRGGIRAVIRQTWWYAALCVLMLPVLAAHFMKPGVGVLLGDRPLITVWYCYSLASPFASIDSLFSIAVLAVLSPAAILLLLLALGGVGSVFADATFFKEEPESGFRLVSVRVGFLLALIASVGLSIFGVPGHLETILIFVVLPTIFAGVGLRWMLRTQRTSEIAVVAVLVFFVVILIGWPVDPYERALLDTKYADVAQRIRTELGPDDLWTAHPRHRADCLYRFGPLPDPVLHLTDSDFREFLATLPREDSAVLVFGRTEVLWEHRILLSASAQWQFVNGFQVVKIPPK